VTAERTGLEVRIRLTTWIVTTVGVLTLIAGVVANGGQASAASAAPAGHAAAVVRTISAPSASSAASFARWLTARPA
jgi:hypothetical protein